MHGTDRMVGAIGLALAGFFIWRATLIDEPFISDPVGPRVFPVIVCVLVALASLVIILRPDPEPAWPATAGLREVAAGVAVFVGYAELLPVLGFVVATFIGSGFLSWRLGARAREAMVAGAAIALGIYGTFHLILGLSLARGPWGF